MKLSNPTGAELSDLSLRRKRRFSGSWWEWCWRPHCSKTLQAGCRRIPVEGRTLGWWWPWSACPGGHRRRVSMRLQGYGVPIAQDLPCVQQKRHLTCLGVRQDGGLQAGFHLRERPGEPELVRRQNCRHPVILWHAPGSWAACSMMCTLPKPAYPFKAIAKHPGKLRE